MCDKETVIRRAWFNSPMGMFQRVGAPTFREWQEIQKFNQMMEVLLFKFRI
ncbi:hypothetical protein FORC73_3085 [Vibrio cholerae]|nr:hypothetical protein FORC73_3085 [Vibrio cholerae]